MSNAITWTDYAEEAPPEEGVYRWRLKSRAVEGMYVHFSARYRLRGGGFSEVLSPEFAHWDGYRFNVPACEWAPDTNEQPPHRPGTYRTTLPFIAIEGVDLLPCPDCGGVPTWHGAESHHGGTTIGASPHEYNRWWLSCCGWQYGQHVKDPRELAKRHNERVTSVDELARLRKAVRDSERHYEELHSACESFWLALDNAIGEPNVRATLGELFRSTIGKVIDAPQGGTDATLRTD